MTDRRVGIRYLGGWGGDFEAEVGAAAPTKAAALSAIVKKLRQRSLKDREKIYKKWHKNYQEISGELIAEEDHEEFLREDNYMKRIKRELGL